MKEKKAVRASVRADRKGGRGKGVGILRGGEGVGSRSESPRRASAYLCARYTGQVKRDRKVGTPVGRDWNWCLDYIGWQFN